MDEEVLKRLVVRIGYDVDAASKRDTEEDQAKMQAKAVAVGQLVASAIQKAAALAVSTIAALPQLLMGAVHGFAEYGDEIAKTSQKLGIHSDALQRLRFAAGRSGVETAHLSDAIKKLAVGYEEASTKGTGPFAEGLGLVGVKLQELEDLSPEDRLGLLADALNEIADPSQKAAAATKLFGEAAGPGLLPLLNVGSKGMAGLGDEAERLGLVLGQDALTNAESLTDALSDLEGQAKVAGVRVGAQLAPMVTKAARGFSDWIAENDQFIEQDLPAILEGVVSAGGDLLAWLADAISEFRQFGREVGMAYDRASELGTEISEALQPAIEAVSSVVSTWADAFTAVNSAIGEGIAKVLDYIGVLDTLKAAWEVLPFTGESVDDLTARLHGGTTSSRGGASFLDAGNEERRQRALGKRIADEISSATAIAAGRETQRQAEELAARGRNAGPDRGRARAAYLRSLRKPAGGGGGSGGSGMSATDLWARLTGSIDEPDDGPLDFLAGALGFGGPTASAGGGSSPLAGAHFSRVDASFNADTTIQINLPPELASLGGAALSRSIAAEVEAVIRERNDEAWGHYQQTVRAL